MYPPPLDCKTLERTQGTNTNSNREGHAVLCAKDPLCTQSPERSTSSHEASPLLSDMFPLILLGLGWAVQRYLKRWTLHITADRLTAEERLKKCPPGVPIANKPDALMLKPGDEDQLETLWGWYNRKNDKGKLYWTTVTPKDKSKIERVLVCFHG